MFKHMFKNRFKIKCLETMEDIGDIKYTINNFNRTVESLGLCIKIFLTVITIMVMVIVVKLGSLDINVESLEQSTKLSSSAPLIKLKQNQK